MFVVCHFSNSKCDGVECKGEGRTSRTAALRVEMNDDLRAGHKEERPSPVRDGCAHRVDPGVPHLDEAVYSANVRGLSFQ